MTVIVSIIGIIVVPFVLSELNWRRKHAKASNDISMHFRSAFSESIAELNTCRNDIHFILSGARINHEAAIDEFRRHLSRPNLAEFDAAVNEYRTLRDFTEPSLIRYYREQATCVPLKDHRCECTEFLVAINKILSFAKPK